MEVARRWTGTPLPEWDALKRKRGFLQIPKCLWKVLTLEEHAFLGLLVDWTRRISPAKYKQNGGWFFCSVKTIQNLSPTTVERVQQRLLKQLARKGFLKTKMKYGTRLLAHGRRRYANHRMIWIDYAALVQSVETPEVAHFRALPYKDYLQTEHWQGIRVRALERAEHRCELCYRLERLEVHHRTYERLGEERPKDVIVLCHLCHAKFHDKLP